MFTWMFEQFHDSRKNGADGASNWSRTGVLSLLGQDIFSAPNTPYK